MSTFVEIAPAEYDANAFAGFNPSVHIERAIGRAFTMEMYDG
jgi:hypothetical protein